MDEPLTKQAARAAYGWGRAPSWPDALALLQKAAAAGEADAGRQFELVTQAPIEDLLAPPLPERISSVALIGVSRGFAPPGFSEWMIERASPALGPAPVNDVSGRAVRTARTAFFGPQERDLVLAIMQYRAAAIMGPSVDFHEPPNVISYEPGQRFSLHADFVEPSIPEFHAELDHLGQRTATFITYLNDDFDGAETWFPSIGRLPMVASLMDVFSESIGIR